MTIARVRQAEKRDASDLAILADIAGHGLPSWLWGMSKSEQFATPIEIGRARALREQGSFSWRNARVAEIDGRVAGMLVGYRQPDTPEDVDMDELPEPIHPLIALEAEALSTWYVNIIAVFSEFRRGGIGGLLMQEADQQAEESQARGLSLIVEDTNRTARGFYERLGFKEAGSRLYIPFPGGPDASRWLLMTRLYQTGRTTHG